MSWQERVLEHLPSGIDLVQLERFLKLSPTERLDAMQKLLESSLTRVRRLAVLFRSRHPPQHAPRGPRYPRPSRHRRRSSDQTVPFWKRRKLRRQLRRQLPWHRGIHWRSRSARPRGPRSLASAFRKIRTRILDAVRAIWSIPRRGRGP